MALFVCNVTFGTLTHQKIEAVRLVLLVGGSKQGGMFRHEV